MPSNSQANLLRTTEAILDAADRTPEVQPDIERERQAVVQAQAGVKSLKARQEELTAQRQEVTQQLKTAIVRLEDTLMIFRAVVKGKLGPRNERLVHFKMAPLRKRSPRSQANGLVKLPAGEASGTKPEAVASPPAKPVD